MERKKDGREKSVRDGERNSGVGHSARVFRSIPPFRLALRSVPVGTPRTPVFPPLWVRTLLSARPAEARPNPSTSSVHPCISSGGRGSERERERETRRKRRRGATAEGDERDGQMDRHEGASALSRGWKGTVARGMGERERRRGDAGCEKRRDPPWLSLNGRREGEMWS